MRNALDIPSAGSGPGGNGPEWTHSFAGLGPDFYTELMPSPLPSPYWVGRNRALARELGLENEWLESAESLAALTGNQLLPGARPLASSRTFSAAARWNSESRR